jgi:hypothetical protein
LSDFISKAMVGSIRVSEEHRALIQLKTLVVELERFAVLRDGARNVVWNTTLNSGLNLKRHFHVCIEEAC